jgi:glycosyltransferase 2 family protein
MNWKRYFWPVVGIGAVIFSLLLLWHELRGISLDDVWDGMAAIPTRGWILAGLSSLVAYAALAGYDHIALLHIGKKVSWLFVTLCSFTTYALSHNIGGSVFSGAVIRYRAYGTRGLTGQEVGVLVAICWITFLCWCSSRRSLIAFPASPITACRRRQALRCWSSSQPMYSAVGCTCAR